MDDRRTFRAYAKLNLCLSVGAPIPEGPTAGFHPIASWMQAIDLFDEITISRLPSGESTYTIRWADDAPRPTPIDWPLEKDLGVRAHKALETLSREIWGQAMPVSIDIAKRIPVGGGLGGGSSDAAAVILGLLSVVGRELPDEKILELTKVLGSDVAFFADQTKNGIPRAALVTGLGDQIQRVEGVPGEVILIIPPYGCPTGPVYQAFDQHLKERLSQDAAERAARGVSGGREKQTGPKDSLVESRWNRMHSKGGIESDHLFNDLAIPAFRVEPRLGKLVTALSNATREPVHVTGSGSCIFLPTTIGKVPRLMERIDRVLATNPDLAETKILHTRLL
jgi:4-diphosphocytidyl-2-C-methyl-D-erythritol kinase